MEKEAIKLLPGDHVDLGLGWVKIRRVVINRSPMNGQKQVMIFREPDGKHEATFWAHERVEVR